MPSDTPARGDTLLLSLDGFAGPLDLLLDLARAQKVDLARISILSLVEQYLAVIERVRGLRLEIAAEWLVMAAWLTWLKSRLLLPPEAETEEGEEAAGTLAARLEALRAVRAAGHWLAERPRLGEVRFPRGAPESLTEIDRSRIAADLPGLLRAYIAARGRTGAARYAPKPLTVWTVRDALRRLAGLLGSVPDWSSLERFLPDHLGDAVERRAALASTLVAGLELAREGRLRLTQAAPFAPILVAASPSLPVAAP